ncbi:hypothetical protein SANTM175S_00289 [Streptomyces antimycoticus]
MPEEANQLFQESRKLYVRLMQGVISSIADTIGTRSWAGPRPVSPRAAPN